MKLIKSTEPVLTHEERFSIQMTYQEMYDLRSMMYLMINGNSIAACNFYPDVIQSIIKATDGYER